MSRSSWARPWLVFGSLFEDNQESAVKNITINIHLGMVEAGVGAGFPCSDIATESSARM